MSIKLLKQLILPIVFSKFATAMFAKAYEKTVPIFVFHQFGNDGHDINQIVEGINFLKLQGFQFITIKQLIARLSNNESLNHLIVITIDDGYESQFNAAKTIMQQCQVPVSLCVINNLVFSGVIPWDMRIKYAIRSTTATQFTIDFEPGVVEFSISNDTEKQRVIHEVRETCEKFKFEKTCRIVDNIEHQLLTENLDAKKYFKPMDMNQLKTLPEIDLIPHTVSHCVLSNEDMPKKQAEILDSVTQLESFLGQVIPAFAYPFGKIEDYDFDAIEVVNNRGMKMALSTVNGYFNLDLWRKNKYYKYQVPRYGYPNNKLDFLIMASWLGRLSEKYSGFNLRRYLKNEFGGVKEFLKLLKHQLTDQILQPSASKRINPQQIKRVIFICKGNICRSPFSEIVMQQSGFPSISAGIHAKDGAPANEGAIRTAMIKSYDLRQHKSTNINKITVTHDDLLVFMEQGHLHEMREIVQRSNAQVTLLGMWSNNKRPYISDPYGKQLEYFSRCFDIVEEATINLSRFIRTANS